MPVCSTAIRAISFRAKLNVTQTQSGCLEKQVASEVLRADQEYDVVNEKPSTTRR